MTRDFVSLINELPISSTANQVHTKLSTHVLKTCSSNIAILPVSPQFTCSTPAFTTEEDSYKPPSSSTYNALKQ